MGRARRSGRDGGPAGGGALNTSTAVLKVAGALGGQARPLTTDIGGMIFDRATILALRAIKSNRFVARRLGVGAHRPH